MLLRNLLDSESCIVAPMQANDRWQAIDELTQALAARISLSDADRAAVTASVRAREETMSTGVGNGIAIPHAASDRVPGVLAMLGVSRDGIDFAALDGEPVRVVVLFVVPSEHFQEHLDTLADIARVLGRNDIRERLCAADAAAEMLVIARE